MQNLSTEPYMYSKAGLKCPDNECPLLTDRTDKVQAIIMTTNKNFAVKRKTIENIRMGKRLKIRKT